jgi:hypothetical protein
MLRALLVLVALVIIGAIVLTATGLVDFRQTQQAQAPRVEVKLNKLDVGTATTNVQVPTIGMTSKQVETPTLRVDKGADGNQQ